jgi:hypothetical protein
MADKRINQFNSAAAIQDTDLFAGYQTDSVKYTGTQLKAYTSTLTVKSVGPGYTLTSADNGAFLLLVSSSATVTINHGLPANFSCQIYNPLGGTVTMTPGANVSLFGNTLLRELTVIRVKQVNTGVTDIYNLDGGFNVLGKHAWPISLGSMYPALTNGVTITQVESTTNKNNYRGWSFAQSGNNYVHFRVPMPKSWNQGTVTFVLNWKTTATTGNVVWSVQGLLRNNGDAEDAAFGTAVTLTSAASASAQATITTAETGVMTPAGTPANGSVLEVRINRNGGSGSDTLAATAVLIGVTMFIVANAGNDL